MVSLLPTDISFYAERDRQRWSIGLYEFVEEWKCSVKALVAAKHPPPKSTMGGGEAVSRVCAAFE